MIIMRRCRDHKENRVPRARKDSQARRVHRDSGENAALREYRESQDRSVFREIVARLARKAIPGLPGPQDQKETEENLVNADLRENRAPRENRAFWVKPALRDQRGRKDVWVRKGNRVLWDRKDRKARLVPREKREILVPRGKPRILRLVR